MIHQKYLSTKKKEEKTKKYNFQGYSAGSIRWFFHDHGWLGENFRELEPDSIKKFIKKILRARRKRYSLFVVPIRNTKVTEK